MNRLSFCPVKYKETQRGTWKEGIGVHKGNPSSLICIIPYGVESPKEFPKQIWDFEVLGDGDELTFWKL